MSQTKDGGHDVEGFKDRSLTSGGESNHKVDSIMRASKEDVGLDLAEEESFDDERTDAVYDEDSSSELELDDLEWIKLLKRSNIGDEKVKEIEYEWTKLIRELRRLSGVL